ncbi:MAG: hypothetical protein ACOY9D_02560 [Pseudomonadota bacterium]
MSLTWLAFGWAYPAFPADEPATVNPPASAEAGAVAKPAAKMRLAPISTRLSGNIGYDIEQRSTSGASPTLRQRIALNLQGRAITYIYKPWIAQVRANLNFIASKNKFQDNSTSNNSILGDTGLFLVPYSRYPFEARITKTQNLSGPGLGTLDYQTTRLDLLQRYAPKEGLERYQLGYNRNKTEDNAPELFRQSEWNFSLGSNRFASQTLLMDGFRQRNTQKNHNQSLQLNQVTAQHRYTPSSQFTVNNNAILRSSYEFAPQNTNILRNRELNNVTSFQPLKAPYTLLGAARVNFSDYQSNQNSTYTKFVNASLGGNYRMSQYITLSASGSVSVSENNSGRSNNLSTYQSATANYPITSFDLDSYHYSSRVNGAITNRTSSSKPSGSSASWQTGSTQTVSVSPSHSLSRRIMLGKGTLDLRFDQMFQATESTRSQAIARLIHSATANLRRDKTSLSLNGRDSRSLNSAEDTFQFLGLNGSIAEEINRNSTISGSLSIQSTRQISASTPNSTTYTSSSANLNYNHRRAFNVSRLSFDSSLRAYSRAPLPVLAASPKNQGPVDWENSLSYVVGLLTADFKVILSKEGDGRSRSLIWFSVKRYF